MVKSVIFLVLFIFSCFYGHSEIPVNLKGNEFSYLRSVKITGSTNLNSFSLRYINHSKTNHPTKVLKTVLPRANSSIEFKIPINLIEGKNNKIVRDFQKLLKATVFENVIVEIDEHEFRSIIASWEKGMMNIKLVLAGNSKTIKANYLIKKMENGTIQLIGETQFNLSSFQLIPPKKFLGLVKVQDVIFITFDILIKTKLPN